jgi:DNA-binding transcriptional MerR regulator
MEVAMEKSPEAFRTISEVADALEVPPHVLRFWETRFAQVKPVKRAGGRRYYRPEDVCLLRGIRGLLYDDGMTIKGVQKILRERGVRHVIGLGTPSSGAEAMPQPPPQPPRPAAPAARPNGPAAGPQRDLFAEPAAARPVAGAAARTLASETATLPRPMDRAALRTLLDELEALRARMVAEPTG